MSNFGTEFEYREIKDDLAFAAEAGLQKRNDTKSIERLQELKASSHILVRGYASWAWRELYPVAPSQSEFHISVDHPAADDAGPGSAAQPWRTIQKAAETAGAGDTVTIHAGLYREWVRPFFGGTADAYLTFRAAPGEAQPVLSAAEIWHTDWRTEDGIGLFSTAYSRHPWDCSEKWSRPLSGAMHAAEQIIVDGVPLLQVDTQEQLREAAGSFRVDLGAGRVHLHLPGNPDLRAHRIERSMRRQVFSPAVRGLGHVRIEGLRFLYGAAPEWFGGNWNQIGQQAVVSVRAGHHWIIENNLIEWGNAQGLDIGEEGMHGPGNAIEPIVFKIGGHHLVRNNRVNHHGVAGIIGTGGVHDILFEGNETNYNGWKQNFDEYETAGLKIHMADRCVIRKHRAHRNESFGVWLDWDCRKNRVTECYLTENLAAGFFHEASPGSLLVDRNIILNTRSRSDGGWGDGLYCHDGNNATFIGNYVEGSGGYGARILALAGRSFNGSPTTAVGNKFFNNVFVNNGKGAISFQPDGALFKGNASEANLFWSNGNSPQMQLEDAGSGVTWETTAIGKSRGKSGGGNLTVSFSEWNEILGYDHQSIVLPLQQLAGLNVPEAERVEIFAKRLKSFATFLPDGLAEANEVKARAVADLLANVVPALQGHTCLRTLWLASDEALQIWQGAGSFQHLHWYQDTPATVETRPHSLFQNEPTPGQGQSVRYLSAGESVVVPSKANDSVAVVPRFFAAVADKEGITVTVAKEARAGTYQILLDHGDETWSAQTIAVAEPLVLHPLQTLMESRAGAVIATLAIPVQNLSRNTIPVDVSVRFLGENYQMRRELPPESTEQILFPISARTAGLAEVTIHAEQQKIEHAEAISFVTVHPATDWDNVTWQSMNTFPDGVFPEGAQAFILFENKLTARFALRHDKTGVYLRIEAHDAVHQQTMPDWQLYLEDGVEILVKPLPGGANRGPFLFLLALQSDGDRQIATFRDRSKAAGVEGQASANQSTGKVTRSEGVTTYDLHLPWAMLNLSTPPKLGEALPLRLSLILNNNDGYGRHGFEWFFGIFHHAGEDSRLGTVWLLDS